MGVCNTPLAGTLFVAQLEYMPREDMLRSFFARKEVSMVGVNKQLQMVVKTFGGGDKLRLGKGCQSLCYILGLPVGSVQLLDEMTVKPGQWAWREEKKGPARPLPHLVPLPDAADRPDLDGVLNLTFQHWEEDEETGEMRPSTKYPPVTVPIEGRPNTTTTKTHQQGT